MSEYLGREDLGIFQFDCFFDAPKDAMDLLSTISQFSAKGLRKYTDVSDSNGSLVQNWVNALGALLWDAEQEGLIEVTD